MKVAISSTGNSLDSRVDQAFGRCSYFAIYDSDTNIHSFVPNHGAAMAGGAGSSAAKLVMDQSVNKIITGKVGVKSRPILEGAGIKISEDQTGTIAEILAAFKARPEPEKQAASRNTVSTGESRQSNATPGGYCFCQACGYKGAGEPGVPCFKQRCPQCNCGLERIYG